MTSNLDAARRNPPADKTDGLDGTDGRTDARDGRTGRTGRTHGPDGWKNDSYLQLISPPVDKVNVQKSFKGVYKDS